MKQLFALFENSENGMSTDKMKWSITTSFIDAGTSRDGDKIQEVRKKPEAKLDSKLHDLKVNRYNFRSYLTYLDVEGGSFDEVFDGEEGDDEGYVEYGKLEKDRGRRWERRSHNVADLDICTDIIHKYLSIPNQCARFRI